MSKKVELSWIKPSGEDLIEMRGKLYKEITTNAPKYGVDLNEKNKLVWKEYKASQTFVPMEFVQAFCNIYKYEAHVYFGDLRPFVLKPFKDNRNGDTEIIYLYLKGNNHYNLLSLDPKSDFELLEGCNFAFNDISFKDNIKVEKPKIIKNINIDNTEEINLCDLGINKDTIAKYDAQVPYVRKTVDCSHLCPSNAFLTVSEMQFGDSRKVYCCLLDTGSSINVLAHSVAYELMEQGLATHVRTESTRISGTGETQITGRMPYFECKPYIKNKDEFGTVEFAVLADETLPCCALMSFNFMSQFKFSLNYMDLNISVNNKVFTEMGILDNDPNNKIVNKINYNNPVDYLTI